MNKVAFLAGYMSKEAVNRGAETYNQIMGNVDDVGNMPGQSAKNTNMIPNLSTSAMPPSAMPNSNNPAGSMNTNSVPTLSTQQIPTSPTQQAAQDYVKSNDQGSAPAPAVPTIPTIPSNITATKPAPAPASYRKVPTAQIQADNRGRSVAINRAGYDAATKTKARDEAIARAKVKAGYGSIDEVGTYDAAGAEARSENPATLPKPKSRDQISKENWLAKDPTKMGIWDTLKNGFSGKSTQARKGSEWAGKRAKALARVMREGPGPDNSVAQKNYNELVTPAPEKYGPPAPKKAPVPVRNVASIRKTTPMYTPHKSQGYSKGVKIGAQHLGPRNEEVRLRAANDTKKQLHASGNRKTLS